MWIPVHRTWRLNERHYGALQGLNKAETAAKFGEAQVKIWRRSYDISAAAADAGRRALPGQGPAVPERPEGRPAADRMPEGYGGARSCPTGTRPSCPTIKAGKRVIIAAHGNSLRALVKYLDNSQRRGNRRAQYSDRRAAGLRARRRPEARQALLPGRPRGDRRGDGCSGQAGDGKEVARSSEPKNQGG